MASGVKNNGENLVGCRVKVWWPKEKSFCEGLVSSQGHSGKNLVVFTYGVEEILNLKKGNSQSVKDMFTDQGKETSASVDASSHTLPEMAEEVRDYDKDLVGCRVKVWRPKSQTCCEGVVASFDPSQKKHLVVYSDGAEELLNLGKLREPDEDVSPDHGQKKHARAPASSRMSCDDELDARWHAKKKHKGQSTDPVSSHGAGSIMFKDGIVPKLEAGISRTDSKLATFPGNDDLLDINGYKMKPTTAPILEAIFAKYGDITSNCLYKSTSVRASLLEVVCNIVQRLKHYDLEAILSHFEVIQNEISDVEASRIDVSWLHQHLTKIHKFATCSDKSLQLKKAKVKSGLVSKAASKELKQRHAELLLAKEKFKEAEKRVNAMRLVNQKIEEDIAESETEEYFWKRRLDDLL